MIPLYPAQLAKILLTGMSGTGRSAALAELAKRGFAVVDTDHGGWTEWSNADGGYVWREGRMAALLTGDDQPTLYVSGTVSNQGRFYPRVDAVVLLSAPADVLLRLVIEPLLRATCTHEVDASQRLDAVVEKLIAIGQEPCHVTGASFGPVFGNDP